MEEIKLFKLLKQLVKLLFKMTKMIYNQCLVCQTRNSGKTIKTSSGMFLAHDGLFGHLQMYFILFPLSVLVFWLCRSFPIQKD